MNNLDDLLDALAGAPKLPGAACTGRSELFDPPDDHHEDDDARTYRLQTAQRICSTCPALTACREWVDSLPRSKRPAGVVAGEIRTTGKEAA